MVHGVKVDPLSHCFLIKVLMHLQIKKHSLLEGVKDMAGKLNSKPPKHIMFQLLQLNKEKRYEDLSAAAFESYRLLS